jgi:hypothetical protein
MKKRKIYGHWTLLGFSPGMTLSSIHFWFTDKSLEGFHGKIDHRDVADGESDFDYENRIGGSDSNNEECGYTDPAGHGRTGGYFSEERKEELEDITNDLAFAASASGCSFGQRFNFQEPCELSCPHQLRGPSDKLKFTFAGDGLKSFISLNIFRFTGDGGKSFRACQWWRNEVLSKICIVGR